MKLMKIYKSFLKGLKQIIVELTTQRESVCVYVCVNLNIPNFEILLLKFRKLSHE